MAIEIGTPQGTEQLHEFLLFHDTVYEQKGARWTAFLPLQLPILEGQSPFTRGRTIRPFWARENGTVIARVLAVVDERYRTHWNDPTLGHLVMFEALPGTRVAVRQMMDAACEWLAGHHSDAARAGFGMLEFPFVIDAYEPLSPPFVRQNPDYYHSLLKDGGFESEQGWVDYKAKVTPELRARWQSAREGAHRAGYRMVPLSDLPVGKRAALYTETWNECFAAHWGLAPFDVGEVETLFQAIEPSGALDLSLLAYHEDEPAGVLLIVPDLSMTAATRPGREIRPEEKVNLLGIGVRKHARGRGVNMAMAGWAYEKLVERGQTWVSYTLVLDDNWPSRRTGEKLGCEVCGNYMVYRRTFRRSR
jgi:GNAT superfamily N-acetyltransferase